MSFDWDIQLNLILLILFLITDNQFLLSNRWGGDRIMAATPLNFLHALLENRIAPEEALVDPCLGLCWGRINCDPHGDDGND